MELEEWGGERLLGGRLAKESFNLAWPDNLVQDIKL
jgi:hypothetical protein